MKFYNRRQILPPPLSGRGSPAVSLPSAPMLAYFYEFISDTYAHLPLRCLSDAATTPAPSRTYSSPITYLFHGRLDTSLILIPRHKIHNCQIWFLYVQDMENQSRDCGAAHMDGARRLSFPLHGPIGRPVARQKTTSRQPSVS